MQQFALVRSDGTEQRFGSSLEANAANIRAGRTGRVEPR